MCSVVADDPTTAKLSQNAHSIKSGYPGVRRADLAWLAANSLCEDRFNRPQLLELATADWVGCAVFDGHGGPQAAIYLEQTLLNDVKTRLAALEPRSCSETAVRYAIKEAFVQLDKVIIGEYLATANDQKTELATKMQHMQRAMSGSCALLLIYDPTNTTVYTACTGDSRAVLGQQNSDGTWETVALSKDQKGDNENEVAKIKQEHTGEMDIVEDGRVLGLAVSRAFGDFQWKATYEQQQDLGKRFWISGPMEKGKIPSPPYLTAEPVVTMHKLERPSFLILATDGLWVKCDNSDVVDLVVRWQEAQPDASKITRMTPDNVWWKETPQVQASYEPGFDFLQRWHNYDVRFTKEKTIVKDLDNVAVHLIRNALGGNHQEILEGRLAMEAPFSRWAWDDITVQVMFFDIDHPTE